ncbi:ATP binding microtubule motor family protein [Tasmannia lanceolata]|uniref:ATP binding microtubule motor family protein n=1 Tax=Tasmannia lanceolata TaxID=3420 RepID=UPI00406329EC
MSNITVCVRFRPLSSREKRDHGNNICIQSLDGESFILKDERDEDFTFCFDRVFYQDSAQADVYEFVAMPMVKDVMNAINGTIITYGQTGAGKTYTVEGPYILECDEQRKGILPRVVDGLFECIRSADEMTKYTVKLSMVEIYMEKVRDLFDLSKDNLQIKEGKTKGIFLVGATEICIADSQEALKCLSGGIANRAVGETQMNMASSRSHCAYIFSVQQESRKDARNCNRVKTGKLVLVDLAGSEKVEKTGAEGRVLDEAKTINKSLSALGNVINALTNDKANHIPYRDSKLTRILQDVLGGNCRTALLCCCSPSSFNASESLSTLRFGARSKYIRTSLRVNSNKDKGDMGPVTHCQTKSGPLCQTEKNSRDKILEKLRENLSIEDVNLLEELFIMEGIIFDPQLPEAFESAYEDVITLTISSLHQAVEELTNTVEKLKRENKVLKAKLATGGQFKSYHMASVENMDYSGKVSGILSFFPWFWDLLSCLHRRWETKMLA